MHTIFSPYFLKRHVFSRFYYGARTKYNFQLHAKGSFNQMVMNAEAPEYSELSLYVKKTDQWIPAVPEDLEQDGKTKLEKI